MFKKQLLYVFVVKPELKIQIYNRLRYNLQKCESLTFMTE